MNAVHDHYGDMRRRVINNSPCPIKYCEADKPGMWLYGDLIFSRDGDRLLATFGDLTIELTEPRHVAELAWLAGSKS